MTLPERRNKTGLRPWQPGQSGNPSGRAKGTVSLVARVKKALRKKESGQRRTYADRIALRVVKDAADGDRDAVNLVFKYVEGLPVAKLPEGATAGIAFIITAPPGVTEPDIIDVQAQRIDDNSQPPRLSEPQDHEDTEPRNSS